MSELKHANNFKDLIIYQKVRLLAKAIFEITKSFPKEEIYSLTNQVQRSSRSVGAQISEAWAKRRYKNHFISKLTDADGEQQETQHWILTASDCGYLSAKQEDNLKKDLLEIGRMLNAMINKADQFCGIFPETISESESEYFITKN